jgi:hypothetical protein
MAFGSSTLGVAYFAGIKLAGYSAFAYRINRDQSLTQPRPVVIGLTRAAIGIGVGVSYAWLVSHWTVNNGRVLFYAGLIPVRIVEWLLLLWLFYRDVPGLVRRRTRYLAEGVGVSYLLDLPAAFAAFALPGGFWIC